MGMRARQWLLLCGLALAVVGMHHVPLAPHHATLQPAAAGIHAAEMLPAPADLPEARSPSDSGTGVGHDLLHLCLVVLSATGGLLLLAWLLVAVTNGLAGRRPGLRPSVRHAWRLPRASGRSLLTFVCVSRT
jgi:hypothetical protein